MQPRGQTEPANSVETRCTTVHHNGASALHVKQNARISARRRGLRENDVVGAQRHGEANHSIHWLWVQTSTKTGGLAGSPCHFGRGSWSRPFVFEELTPHLGHVIDRLVCTVREAARGKHRSRCAPLCLLHTGSLSCGAATDAISLAGRAASARCPKWHELIGRTT